MKINIVGAFDRYNYGDLLFPLILENAIMGNSFLKDSDIEYYGIREFNGEKYKCKSTQKLCKLNEGEYIINAGGNTLVAEIQYLFLDNLNDKWKLLLYRIFRKLVGEKNFTSIVMKKNGINRVFPYDFKTSKMIYNCVGGDINQLSEEKRKIILETLSETGYISVRDIDTYNSIPKELNPYLVPDSAIVLSEQWEETYLRGVCNQDLVNLVDKIKSQYIVFQISRGVGEHKVEQICSSLKKIYSQHKMKIWLLPIGIAPSHGDIEILRIINRKLPEETYYYENIDIMDTTFILSQSYWFVGSSLHGNLISFSYQVPSVLIADVNTKNYKYFETWMKNSSCYCVSLDTFVSWKEEIKIKRKETDNSSLSFQQELVHQNFERLFSYIEHYEEYKAVHENDVDRGKNRK